MCSLFGLIDYRNSLSAQIKGNIIAALGIACEARGTDATGIAYNSGGGLHIYKKPLVANLMHWHIPADAQFIMGHTRLTTQGNAKHNYNNHPFRGQADVSFALVHNGMLHNDTLLRKQYKLPKPKIETDSFVAVQLIEQQHMLDFVSLAHMAEQLEGSFAFTVLDERNNLYFVKGDNPLCIYHYPKLGLYLYASLEGLLLQALQALPYNLGKPEHIDLMCGDIMRVDCRGNRSKAEFCPDKLFGGYNYLYSWGSNAWRRWNDTGSTIDNEDRQYISELKAAAAGLGAAPEDIDTWLAQGFYPEDIEEMLYYGQA